MALMTLMAGVRTPSPMIMDVASRTTASSSARAPLLVLRIALTCMCQSCQPPAETPLCVLVLHVCVGVIGMLRCSSLRLAGRAR